MKKGFTLVELLVVMGVLAVLLGGVVVSVDPVERLNQAGDSNALRVINQVSTALSTYAASNDGVYPPASDWTTLGDALKDSGDLSAAPNLPSGRDGSYVVNGSDVCVFTTVISKKNRASVKPTAAVDGETAFWKWSSATATATYAKATTGQLPACP